jgi:hypothetical protein
MRIHIFDTVFTNKYFIIYNYYLGQYLFDIIILRYIVVVVVVLVVVLAVAHGWCASVVHKATPYQLVTW